jgi:DNA-binding GntR family transcriptional regulator
LPKLGVTDERVETLDRRTIVEHLVESLREGIIRGRYENGTELNQAALAKEFGVARIPVREALRQLQGEGLVTSVAHMRVVVSGITPEIALEQIEVRAAIEHYLLGRAAPRLTSIDIAALERLCDAMDKATKRGAWLALNEEFHRALVTPAKSTFAADLSRQLATLIEKYLDERSPRAMGSNKEVNAEHRKIVAALADGRFDDARSELLSHIHHTRDRVHAFIASESVKPSKTA